MSKHKTYPPSKRCATCGGRCCKRIGGHYSPRDFRDLSFDGLKQEIEKGHISIDWWENFPDREYFLRARHVGEPIVYGSWGGVCVNLSNVGCDLPREARPLGCRNLKPGIGACTGTYTKEVCKNEWKEYSEVLTALAVYFEVCNG